MVQGWRYSFEAWMGQKSIWEDGQKKVKNQKEIVIPSHKLVPEKYIKIQVFVYYVV